MRPKPFVEVLELWDERKKKREASTKRGEIVSVTPTVAMVRVGGSHKVQPAKIPAGMSVVAGDWCMLTLNQGDTQTKWMISEVLNKYQPGEVTNTEQTYVDLLAPANLTAMDEALPGVAMVKWDVPVQYPLAIEVQTSPDDSVWTTVLYTRGSYAIIDTDTEIYVRVRCLTENGLPSAWTASIQVTPGTETTGGSGNASSTITSDYTIQSGHAVYWIGPIIMDGELTIDGELHIL